MKQKFAKALQTVIVALLVALSTGSSYAKADTTVIVDPSIQFQKFEGWGISLAWWANVIGGFPEPARSHYLNMAFDRKSGLGLTVVRYNIGGGENPEHLTPNKQFLTFRTAVPGYEPAAGQWDWAADANQRYVLKVAISKGADQLEAFANSPPYWMTNSGSVTGAPRGANNLNPADIDAFADYLTTVVMHFHDDWGVTFRDLEPLNEPSGDWSFGNYQEGCHFDYTTESPTINATASALARLKLTTTVTASDEPSIYNGIIAIKGYDPTALNSITKINVHSYGGGNRTDLAQRARAAGKDLWLSEYGDNDASGLTTSRRILTDMNGLHPTAWVGWQFVDSANGWGCLRNPLDSETDTAMVVNEKYYVMANYTRFIRPGDVFIKIDDSNSLCAFNAKSRRLVIVTTNNDDDPITVKFDLSKFDSIGTKVESYQTSPTENLADLAPTNLTNRGFSATLPGSSVTTFVIDRAKYAGEVTSGL